MERTRAGDDTLAVRSHTPELPSRAWARRPVPAVFDDIPNLFVPQVLQSFAGCGPAGSGEHPATSRLGSTLETRGGADGPSSANPGIGFDGSGRRRDWLPARRARMDAGRAMAGVLRGVSVRNLTSQAAPSRAAMRAPAGILPWN